MDTARQLRPLQHGTPCEAQAKKKAKTMVSDVAMQHVTEGDVDSSPQGSGSDTSSSSQTASTVDAEDVDTDLEELQDHYSSLRSFSNVIRQSRPANTHGTPKDWFAQEWDSLAVGQTDVPYQEP